jgi:hypothetical protein
VSFDFGPIIDSRISPYTIGFVLIDGGNPAPLGSGTLVRCRSTQGILTCGHVLAELPQAGEFGAALFGLPQTRDQRMRIAGEATVAHAVNFYTAPGGKDGPDLAFIPIPPAQFSDLSASGSVLDLDLGKDKASSERPEGAEVLEAVAGVVGQLTAPASSDGSISTLTVEGLVCPGSVIAAPKVGQWDQLQFKPQPQSESVLPTNFRGTSGGGIWRVYLKKDAEGRYSPLETRLTGVAYWQDKIAGSLGIIGHGPISIYGHLLTEIYRRWPPK